jgi:hypothetical protein
MRLNFLYEPKVEVIGAIPHWGYERIGSEGVIGVGGEVGGILGDDSIWNLAVDFLTAGSNARRCRWCQS